MKIIEQSSKMKIILLNTLKDGPSNYLVGLLVLFISYIYFKNFTKFIFLSSSSPFWLNTFLSYKQTTRMSNYAPEEPPANEETFQSLPDDLAVSCLALVSRSDHAALFLVSKRIGTLVASPELYKARSLLGRTEEFLYVCLNQPQAGLYSAVKRSKQPPPPSSLYLLSPLSPKLSPLSWRWRWIGGFM